MLWEDQHFQAWGKWNVFIKLYTNTCFGRSKYANIKHAGFYTCTYLLVESVDLELLFQAVDVESK